MDGRPSPWLGLPDDSAAMYVGCLRAWNSGQLHGAWVECDDVDAVKLKINAMLAESPFKDASAWTVLDHQGFHGCTPKTVTTAVGLAGLIGEHGELAALVMACCNNDLARTRSRLTHSFCGIWSSMGDFAESVSDVTLVPKRFRGHIDFQSMGEAWTRAGEYTGYWLSDGRVGVISE